MFNRRVVSIFPSEFKRYAWMKRRLCKKTRRCAVVRLRSVHEKWVAQKHCPGCSRRDRLWQPGSRVVGCPPQIEKRKAVFSCRSKK
jgi:hypothetical protein